MRAMKKKQSSQRILVSWGIGECNYPPTRRAWVNVERDEEALAKVKETSEDKKGFESLGEL